MFMKWEKLYTLILSTSILSVQNILNYFEIKNFEKLIVRFINKLYKYIGENLKFIFYYMSSYTSLKNYRVC